MTTAPEQTTAATRASANASMPPAAPAPVAAPVAGYVGTVLALLLLGAGVIALRDGAVSAGWLDGRPFTTTFVGWLDGLSFAPWMVPVGLLAVVVGAWFAYAALRPRRPTAVAVAARSSVWMAPADLARVASRAAETVPGVLEARSSTTLRTLTVTAHTTAGSGAPQIKAAVTEAVGDAATIVSTPPKIRVRTRTGGA
jgi:hypothetical protein